MYNIQQPNLEVNLETFLYDLKERSEPFQRL